MKRTIILISTFMIFLSCTTGKPTQKLLLESGMIQFVIGDVFINGKGAYL